MRYNEIYSANLIELDMTMDQNDISSKMSDYLVEIYRESERNGNQKGYVSTSVLADLLNVTAPAVNRMVTRLKEQGLLLHEPYQGIRLTPEGEKEALIKLRRHRIIESFLVKVMGFEWHEVYEEAQNMSGALSDMLTERMLEMANNPTHCPHGEPIPDANGTLPEMNDILLSETSENDEIAITRVLTREPDRLSYIEALGLKPDVRLSVIHVAPFNGPMQLKVHDEYRIIGHNLAELIRVRVLNKQ